MENYQVNRYGCRPYNRTCGMMNSSIRTPDACCKNESGHGGSGVSECNRRTACDTAKQSSCLCTNFGQRTSDKNMYEHLKHLIPAMAYVPMQNFTSAYDLNYALSAGTIFPQLCKPFCGQRGRSR